MAREPVTAAPAPGEPAPPRRAWPAYVLLPLLAAATVFAGMRLEGQDFALPLGYNGGDVMLILPMVQAGHETGSHWFHPRLGAPEGQDLRDFPVVDYLHFAGLWALAAVFGDLMTAFNLYFLLTYPLTALTTLYALRRLGLSVPAACCGAMLYAFTPYHQLRGLGHYFLSAYYVVPLTLVVALEVAAGRHPGFGPAGSGRWSGVLTRETLSVLGIAALTAVAGAYYAFFGCAVLAFAGVYGSLAARSWRPGAAAAWVVGVVVLGGVLGHLPAILHQREAGRNVDPTFRRSSEAEHYGLKVAQLVLPINNHRVDAFARARAGYDSADRPVQTENGSSTLGVAGTTGLVLLAAGLLLPGLGWLRAPAAACGFCVLLGTVGGLGSLFNHAVSAQVRAYCRVCIFIAFLAALAACAAVDRLVAARPRVRWPVFALIGVLGILDQTDREWFTASIVPGRDALGGEYLADRAFYAQADGLGDDPMVFCLPHLLFPEGTGSGTILMYEHARGTVHTRRARWSYGSMKGRAPDDWQRETSWLRTPAMLDRLAGRGFAGLYVDARGYPPEAAARMLSEIRAELGPGAELTPHADGGRRLFDIRAYAARRRAALGAAAFDRLAARDRDAVRAEYLAGFSRVGMTSEDSPARVGAARAEMALVNPGAQARAVRVSFTAWSVSGPTDLSLDGGPVWSAAGPLTGDPSKWSGDVVVPPGRTRLHFRCPPPPGWLAGDSRRAVFAVTDLAVVPAGPE